MGNETRNLWLSIGAGVFATFLLYSYSQEKKAEYDKKFGTTKRVIVAKEDIAEMQTIYDTMVEAVEKPADFVEPEAAITTEEVVGNVAAIPIKKGQQIVKNKLHTPGPDTGISQQVAPTKRAIAIPIDEMRAVAKLIRPGDRIDILAAVDIGKGVNQERKVQTLMQDVVVLATGVSIVNNIPRVFELDASGRNLIQTTLTGDTKYTTITVEADPKQVQDLVYILSTAPGNLFFSLRNPNDRNLPRYPASTVGSIVGNELPAAPPVVIPQAPIQVAPPAPAPSAPRTPPKRNGFRTL
ncbi:MAG: Flp pilus assembly protein CpaB [Bdellovibrionaceae bacterium]|nr:Flp pilus assembly protein CpaB [Pseudobdellovibrionaceae bacterium]MBX3034144.1 Flp pilus assembly protein CpaB [Pseudobdellovibrionaceae bacterium]